MAARRVVGFPNEFNTPDCPERTNALVENKAENPALSNGSCRHLTIHFPRPFTLPLPLGGHLAFYGEIGPVTVMAWDRHEDAGWCVGTYSDWSEAVAAGLVYQADMAASHGGAA